MSPIKWDNPVKDLEQGLQKIKDNCITLQFEHRLDPYSGGVTNFERKTGYDDKIVNIFLGDADIKKICDALKKNKSVKALDLSGNKLGLKGVERLCELLKENDTIEILFLEDNKIDDECCEEIASCLSKNKTLKQLNLSGNLITSDGARKIAHSLLKNKSLEAIWLNRNLIRNGGAKAFGYTIKYNTVLDTLCLEDNKIRESGAKVLAAGVRKNKDLQTLNLGRNKIGAKGAKYFKKAILQNKEHDGQLRTLVLDGNRMNESDMEKLENISTDKGIEFLHNSHYDIYGNNITKLRKGTMKTRIGNYLKYHTKPRSLFQGHYDSRDEVDSQL